MAHTHTHTHTHTLISRGCSCRHAIVLKGHEKINLQCKCHIIETEHEANSGKPRKHIRSRKDGRYAGMANSGIPSCCLALLDQVSSKTPGPPAMWNFRPCSRTLHTHTHTHRKGVKQNHNCGKNASMVQMHASTKGFSEVPVKWPHESASCGYADESELNSSETKASINTPNCRVGV